MRSPVRPPSRLAKLLTPSANDDVASSGFAQSLLVLCFVAVAALLFWPALFQGHRLAFRDVSHFYLPLYEYLAARLSAGDFPLWNGLDQYGVPVAGEATAGLFYPGNVLFWVLPASPSMTVYVLAHLAIAAAGAYRLSRHLRIVPFASVIAAMAYAFASPVFFLYSNPPFLVGAAWLPWQVLTLRLLITHPGLSNAARAAVPAALSILGGEPQMVVHVWLLVGAFALFRLVHRRFVTPVDGTSPPRHIARLEDRFAGYLFYGTLLLSATLIQVWPAMEWSRTSWRRATPPPTIYAPFRETGGHLSLTESSPAWWQHDHAGAHGSQIYRFSVAPWHYLTLAIPNGFGNLFPINSRWAGGIPSEPAMWTPSLYCGLLLFVAALTGFVVHVEPHFTHPHISFCRITIVFSLLATLGEFGLVRAAQTLLDSDLKNANGAVGGLYWLLVTVVPFYANFRYPAKWLVPFALGVSVLAAAVLQQPRSLKPLRWSLVAILIATAIVLAIALSPSGASLLDSLSAAARIDEFWGPVSSDAAGKMLTRGCLQTLLVGAAILLLLRGKRTRFQWVALTAILAFDLAVANVPLVATVAGTPSPVAAEALPSSVPPPRELVVYDGNDWPAAWRRTADPNRIAAVESALPRLRFGRWNLPRQLGKLNAYPSLRTARAVVVTDAIERWAAERNQGEDRADRITALSGLDRVVSMDASQTAEPRVVMLQRPADDARWLDVWQTRLPVTNRELPEVADAIIRGVDSAPLVEWKSPNGESPFGDEKLPGDNASVIPLAKWSEDVATYRVESSTSGRLFRPVVQDGNWAAVIYDLRTGESNVRSVQPTDLIGQSVAVPAGLHRVRFEYRPRWLTPSLIVSISAWPVLLLLILRSHLSSDAGRRARRHERPSI